MKLKRFICGLLVLLLTGCGIPMDGLLPTPSQETTVPTLPPVELEAVNALSFRASTESPEIFVLDHRTVAFFVPEFATVDNKNYTRATILDLYTDTVIAETRLEGKLAPLPFCGGDTIALGEAAT